MVENSLWLFCLLDLITHSLVLLILKLGFLGSWKEQGLPTSAELLPAVAPIAVGLYSTQR